MNVISNKNSLRAQELRKKRREQGLAMLELSIEQRINLAEDLYLQMIALLTPEEIMRDMERRIREKVQWRCGLGRAYK